MLNLKKFKMPNFFFNENFLHFFMLLSFEQPIGQRVQGSFLGSVYTKAVDPNYTRTYDVIMR